MRNNLKVPLIAGGVLAGAGLAYAANKLIKSGSSNVARDFHHELSITINKSPAELFLFWRKLSNLPLFMSNLDSVVELDNGTSHWIARGPLDTKIEWDAEIYNEKENELIAWRSLENADIVNAGTVRFESAPGNRGTRLRVTINYNIPAGAIGKNIAHIMSNDPAQLIDHDMRRFKQLMEAGEIATINGQPSGRATETEPVAEPGVPDVRPENLSRVQGGVQ